MVSVVIEVSWREAPMGRSVDSRGWKTL
jgi:hypothetical protein